MLFFAYIQYFVRLYVGSNRTFLSMIIISHWHKIKYIIPKILIYGNIIYSKVKILNCLNSIYNIVLFCVLNKFILMGSPSSFVTRHKNANL